MVARTHLAVTLQYIAYAGDVWWHYKMPVNETQTFLLIIRRSVWKHMDMSRDQNAGQNHNLNIVTNRFKSWGSSDIWEQP